MWAAPARAGGLTLSADTLSGLLRDRCDHLADHVAYGFFSDGEDRLVKLTYGELDTGARRIAAMLGDRITPGGRAVLVYAPGLDFIVAFFGCLYAGVIAVPVYPPLPPRMEAGMKHLAAVIGDVDAEAVLSTSDLLALFDNDVLRGHPAVPLLATDQLPQDTNNWRDPGLTPDTIAIVQFTSGSTSTPKGVVLSHDNLLSNAGTIARTLGLSTSSVGLSWLPTFHDMGLIGFVITPLLVGAPSFMFSPLHFLERPARWLEAVTRVGATISAGPTFAYELCLKRVSDEDCAPLDLSSWKVAITAAEPVRPEIMRRFVDRFRPVGLPASSICSCYGLAEASLLVTGAVPGSGLITGWFDGAALEHGEFVNCMAYAPGAVELASSGRVPPENEVAIVDVESAVVAEFPRIGEIWVRSPSVAKGYWRCPDATAEAFGALLDNDDGQGYLRTGDLGFIENGELFVTGRIKDLVICRGRNIYPQDVEATVQAADPRLRTGCGAVFGIEFDGVEALIVVQETKEQDPEALEELIGVVRQVVVDYHGIRPTVISLVPPQSVPKTSSGKLQRTACRDLFLHGGLDILAEWRHGSYDGGTK